MLDSGVLALAGIISVVVLTGCAAAAQPATSTAGTRSHEADADHALVALDCAQRPRVRPSSYMIACADGGNLVDQLHWSNWGQTTAAATGIGTVNDCLPDCAHGHDQSDPVTVTLADPAPWPPRPGTQRFTKLTVHYPGAHPENASDTEEYPLLFGDTPPR